MPGPIYWDGRLQVSAEQVSFDGGGGGRVDDASSFVASEQRSASGSSEPSALGEDATTDLGSGIRDRELSLPHQALDAMLNDHRSTKEVGVHFILMFGIAFCLVRIFNRSKRSISRSRSSGLRSLFWVLGALVCILLLALSIELLQELLPRSFARGFAWSDLWVSLVGGMLGAGLGILLRRPEKLQE